LKISILTLFPDVVRTYLGTSILGLAEERGLVGFDVRDIREHAEGKHRQVDDRPFGGGPGMVLMPGPVVAAVEAARTAHEAGAEVILLTPQGERLDQRLAEELARAPGLILICGRYEGFDERVREVLHPREVSIGDYVLAGGEIPALAVTEAVVRLLPGVLGHADSAKDESFVHGLLEGPQYTRPREFRGHGVPDVLFSGDHAAIAAWREKAAEERTRVRRQDLWQQKNDTAFRRKEEPR
jgi:tRNA (guanine37-N1)-methyltransferase